MSAPTLRRSTPEARAADRHAMDLLARLGLDRRATPEEIETAHDEVTAFLATAPRSLRDWAHVQAAAADEALASLTDPAAMAGLAALAMPASRPESVPGGSATPPARRETSSTDSSAGQVAGEDLPADDTSAEDYDALYAAVTPSAHREMAGPAKARRRGPQPIPTAPQPAELPFWRRLRRAPLAIAAGLLLVAVVAAVGFGFVGGAPKATPLSSAAAAQAALDAQVGPLMVRLQANASDTDALMSLGNLYFQAGQYDIAATWFQKLVAIQPTNEPALLALGASSFNVGDLDNAEKVWKQVLALDASSVEAHYDLGFLYLNRQPPDMTGVKREWGEVIRLDPGSDVAKTVQAHLDALSSPAPSGSAPAASGSPAATPATSASATP